MNLSNFCIVHLIFAEYTCYLSVELIILLFQSASFSIDAIGWCTHVAHHVRGVIQLVKDIKKAEKLPGSVRLISFNMELGGKDMLKIVANAQKMATQYAQSCETR